MVPGRSPVNLRQSTRHFVSRKSPCYGSLPHLLIPAYAAAAHAWTTTRQSRLTKTGIPCRQSSSANRFGSNRTGTKSRLAREARWWPHTLAATLKTSTSWSRSIIWISWNADRKQWHTPDHCCSGNGRESTGTSSRQSVHNSVRRKPGVILFGFLDATLSLDRRALLQRLSKRVMPARSVLTS